MSGARLVARCVRGLEPLVAQEILRDRAGAVRHIGHREIHWDDPHTHTPPRLRTADDALLYASGGADIGRTREHLPDLLRLLDAVDLAGLYARRRAYTGTGVGTGVEVSASFLGKRTYNRYDLEDTLGEALGERLEAHYFSRRDDTRPPEGASGWRLTLDGEAATLMLRVFPRPLHRRAYKHATVAGTVRAPVAAAMARMADIAPGHRVVDPCCGAGTLVIEAREAQPDADCRGFDLDQAAVHAARENAGRHAERRPEATVRVRQADAARLPLPDASVDRVLCNPPWGARVPPAGELARRPGRLWRETRRILRPDGRVVVLLADPRALADAIGHGLLPNAVQRLRVNGADAYIAVLVPSGEHAAR